MHSDSFEDTGMFAIPYRGSEHAQSDPIKDGRYVVEIVDVKINKDIKGGIMVGGSEITWRLQVQDGPSVGMHMVATSPLTPPPDMDRALFDKKYYWLTERYLRAAYPSIQRGQECGPNDLMGQKIEVEIRTKLDKQGKTSMFVIVDKVYPHVKVGTIGDLSSLSPDEPPSAA